MADGAVAGSLETHTLDFKRDPHTVSARGERRGIRARLVEVWWMPSFAGGRIVLGVDDRTPGREAFIGTKADPAFLRNRIYGNTRPQLTVHIDEIQFAGKRLLVITVPEGLDLVTDSKGKAVARQGASFAPLTEDARRALAHERRNPDLTARPSDRSWRDVVLTAVAQARTLLSQLVDLRAQMADLDDASLLRALNLLDRDHRLLIAGEIFFSTPDEDRVDILTRPAALPSLRFGAYTNRSSCCFHTRLTS